MFIYPSACSCTFKLKFTVPYLCSFPISCSCVNMGCSKQQCNFNSLIVHRLEWSSYINWKFSQLFHSIIIYKVSLLQLCAVEYYSHNSLSGSDRAVCLHMNFIYTYCLTSLYKGIEYILTEVLTLDYYFLLFWVFGRVKCGKSVDTVGHFRDSGGDWTGI